MRALPLTVERLTFGPDALAHAGRQVVFLPYAAPGDQVTAEVVEQRPGYLRARVATVDVPGPDRVLPGCAAFPICGGCQWQHIAPAAQRAAKSAIVAEQLARIGRVRDVAVEPTLPSPADWGSRARITLVADGRRLGFHRARSHALVEVDDCPVADPALLRPLPAVRRWATAVRMTLERVTLAVAPGGVALAATAAGTPGAADVAATEELLASTAAVRGAVLLGRGTRVVVGDPEIRVPLEPGLDLVVPADVFTQVNPGANALLVATVARLLGDVAGRRILDLYCGAGNFGLPLARRGAVVLGIERSPHAVVAGAANAERLGLGGATFRAATVARALADVAAGTIDAVVLDPPRAGAADAVAQIAALAAPRIVYVSCDPATLARDVRSLAAHGYRLGTVQPIDVFPQTYHVETVAELRLT